MCSFLALKGNCFKSQLCKSCKARGTFSGSSGKSQAENFTSETEQHEEKCLGMKSKGRGAWKAECPCPWKGDGTRSFKVSPNQNQLGFSDTGKSGRGLKKHLSKLPFPHQYQCKSHSPHKEPARNVPSPCLYTPTAILCPLHPKLNTSDTENNSQDLSPHIDQSPKNAAPNHKKC